MSEIEVTVNSTNIEVVAETPSSIEVVQNTTQVTSQTSGIQGSQGPQGIQGTQGLTGDPGDPGPATPYDYSGTGFPEGVVTATVGQTYRDNSGTNGAWLWIKATGSGNTGWKVVYGDTGWRDISANLTASATTGALWIKRVNETVYVQPRNISAASGAVITSAWVLGFIPITPVLMAFSGSGMGEQPTYAILETGTTLAPSTSNTLIRMKGTTTGVRGYGVTVFTTNEAWPAALPGTAV